MWSGNERCSRFKPFMFSGRYTKWAKDRKNHSERCAFMEPLVPENIFDENKNWLQSKYTASIAVFENCFDAFQSYKEDVHALLSQYGYDKESNDVSSIDKFFGVAFKDMADWPSDNNENPNVKPQERDAQRKIATIISNIDGELQKILDEKY